MVPRLLLNGVSCVVAGSMLAHLHTLQSENRQMQSRIMELASQREFYIAINTKLRQTLTEHELGKPQASPLRASQNQPIASLSTHWGIMIKSQASPLVFTEALRETAHSFEALHTAKVQAGPLMLN